MSFVNANSVPQTNNEQNKNIKNVYKFPFYI